MGCFLAEAILLSGAGGAIGLAVGALGVRVLVGIWPALPAVAAGLGGGAPRSSSRSRWARSSAGCRRAGPRRSIRSLALAGR